MDSLRPFAKRPNDGFQAIEISHFDASQTACSQLGEILFSDQSVISLAVDPWEYLGVGVPSAIFAKDRSHPTSKPNNMNGFSLSLDVCRSSAFC